MWIKLILATVLALALVLAAIFAYGPYRWQARTETLREELRAHASATPRDRYEPAQLENLPAPVERYLRKVVAPGQRPIRSVRIRHRGEFNVAESGENELVDRIRSEGRYRNVDGKSIRTPWQGRFWAYEQRGGTLVPTEGEGAWLLPEGRLPYWRASITELEYDVATQPP